MEIEDKVAVVTGAGSGIGRAVARRLAHEGAAVIVADVDEAAGESAVTPPLLRPTMGCGCS